MSESVDKKMDTDVVDSWTSVRLKGLVRRYAIISVTSKQNVRMNG